ncbi:hypothetical protein [Enterovibrio baiacu]|uniref:hypothetical protein n=1 Tax=Enterovibrio baiacu TaxID=2491023 RepID=UPI003D103C34
MQHYQISKYKELNQQTWSSITDIGNIFEGITLTWESYIHTESLYIKLIKKFVSSNKCEFKVHSYLDLRDDSDPIELYRELKDLKKPIEINSYLTESRIEEVSRYCLRDLMGIRLVTDDGTYITFGDDLYLRIGIDKNNHINLNDIVPEGIYVKKIKHAPWE